MRSIGEGYPGPMSQLEPAEYHIHLGSLVLLLEKAYKRRDRVSILLVSKRLLAKAIPAQISPNLLISLKLYGIVVVVRPPSYTILD